MVQMKPGNFLIKLNKNKYKTKKLSNIKNAIYRDNIAAVFFNDLHPKNLKLVLTS